MFGSLLGVLVSLKQFPHGPKYVQKILIWISSVVLKEFLQVAN